MVIIALMGKSGSGKSTVEQKLSSMGFNRMISYTTRKIRDGEVNHREYHFVTREQFQGLIEKGIVIEWAEYNGNLYGAPKPVGYSKNVVVVERDGYLKLKDIYKNQVVGVYIDVRDEEIDRRLEMRNNTTDIEARKFEDEKKFDNIENIVDLVVDGNKSVSEIVITILNHINYGEKYDKL